MFSLATLALTAFYMAALFGIAWWYERPQIKARRGMLGRRSMRCRWPSTARRGPITAPSARRRATGGSICPSTPGRSWG
ncbi:hypothetical protein [Brevundimonas naejangsanensis]|uniref:hypothetical protein n=1 Tax=Brevundimonas naejangsanensis TaxID=588932 RepID=UPI0026EEDFFB|nr:hypothetical protein [Brevundimonas naejangsanensis]